MRTKRTTARISSAARGASAVLSVVALVAAPGCSSTAKDPTTNVSYGALTSDLTPELRATTERPVDVDRHLAVMKNANWKSFWNDLGRTFYTDHPSRLSPYPIGSLSGVPR